MSRPKFPEDDDCLLAAAAPSSDCGLENLLPASHARLDATDNHLLMRLRGVFSLLAAAAAAAAVPQGPSRLTCTCVCLVAAGAGVNISTTAYLVSKCMAGVGTKAMCGMRLDNRLCHGRSCPAIRCWLAPPSPR